MGINTIVMLDLYLCGQRLDADFVFSTTHYPLPPRRGERLVLGAYSAIVTDMNHSLPASCGEEGWVNVIAEIRFDDWEALAAGHQGIVGFLKRVEQEGRLKVEELAVEIDPSMLESLAETQGLRSGDLILDSKGALFRINRNAQYPLSKLDGRSGMYAASLAEWPVTRLAYERGGGRVPDPDQTTFAAFTREA